MTNPPWVLAPREPTEEMLRASPIVGTGLNTYGDWSINTKPAEDVYCAMLAALPAPPIAPEALDRLATFERALNETAGAFTSSLYQSYQFHEGAERSYSEAIAALIADLRALLKAVGR